ncbi:FxSxx-COOH system tetratricopeptide repeat protein [Kitasatospora sp. NPDC051853]|uniref:FxSxx-COOH system tetratricopeptide repeat protein n=1 Tax=Kitasatospora sp. NPDC051853 TaxID=3364058 RepID=UPI0037AB06A1
MHYEASGPRSISADSIGTAHTGDTTVLPPEPLHSARDVQAPPGLNNLDPRPLCVGRDEDLRRLRTALTTSGDAAITQASTVHGLGGIGKSTLALAYAHRHRRDHTLTWWLNAESPARIEESLAELTLRLRPEWAGRTTTGQRAAWALTWLQWHPGWLLVLDNVETVKDVSPLLGSLTGGHHLLTSRRAVGWPHSVRTHPLGILDPTEATELLCHHALGGATPTPRQQEEARALATDLGHLPLALEQAGAYLRQHPGISIETYRRRLPVKLDKAAEGIDAERTIARIWSQTLTTLDPRAVTVLQTLAWFAPDDIPVTLLGSTDDDLHEALAVLAAYSMATVTAHTVSVHRLLQAVLRSTATAEPDGTPAGRRSAERAVVRAFPADGPPPDQDALMPHLIALASTSPAEAQDDVIALFVRATQYLRDRGHMAHGVPLHQAIVARHEHVLGDTHPRTLTSRHNLADAYESAGDLERAIPLYETTLAQSEQVLGDTHPATLVSRNNLASTYESAGDLERAIPLYETTLAQREQTLGHTHPATLTSRNNLAYAYKSAGDLERATFLYERTLAQREQALGHTHPSTLTSRNNLAAAYSAAGDLERAIPLYETTLAQCEQVLGDTHPDTVSSRNNLASALRKRDRLNRDT